MNFDENLLSNPRPGLTALKLTGVQIKYLLSYQHYKSYQVQR